MNVLGRVLDRATRTPWLTVFAALQAAAMLAVAGRHFAVLVLGGALDPRTGHPRTGDFLAFHTAATLVWRGQGQQLYDLHAQRVLQEQLAGARLSVWQPYVNPPLLALLLAPLASLALVPAFLVFCGLMCLALALGLWLVLPRLRNLAASRRAWVTAALLVVAFHPVLRTAIGGQNTPLTMLLLAATLVAAGREHCRWLAGLPLGLLSYKPQFVAIPALLLVQRRELGALLVAAATTAAHYGLAALALGPAWPGRMLAMLEVYWPMEAASNRLTHFSLLPVLQSLLPWPWSAVAASAACAAVLVAFWRLARRSLSPHVQWALALTATMLVSPHLQYYDAGLLALVALLGVEATLQQRKGALPSLTGRGLLALAYQGYPLYQVAKKIGFQPLVLWLAGAGIWLARLANGRQSLDNPGRGR